MTGASCWPPVPRSLPAASIHTLGEERGQLEIAELANEILAHWDRPPITVYTLG